MGGMIPWLILSHVSDDVIKKDYEIKEKEGKRESHTFGLRKEGGGGKLPPFDPYGQCSKKEERNSKRKEEMGRKRKRNEKKENKEKQRGMNKTKEKKTWGRRKEKNIH